MVPAMARIAAMLALLLAPTACERSGSDKSGADLATAAVLPATPALQQQQQLAIKPKGKTIEDVPAEAPLVSLLVTPAGIWIGDGTRTRFAATCPGGAPDLAAVTAELCARARITGGAEGAEIAAASQAVPYQTLVQVIDATQAAGMPDIGMLDPPSLHARFPARASAADRLRPACGATPAGCRSAAAPGRSP
jgi:hypothetical protein